MKKFFRAIWEYLKSIDKLLMLFCLIASSISLVMLYSIIHNGFLSNKKLLIIQAVAIALGIAAAIIVSLFDYHTLAKLWKIYTPAALFLVLLTFTPLGITRAGSDDKAWLSLFGITTLQPSELLKIAFVFTFALHLQSVREDINHPRNILLLCLHGAAPTLLIMAQGDFGSALVFLFIFIVMLFTAGISWKYVLGGIAAAAVAAPIVWNFVLPDYLQKRILIAFHPELDPMGTGYHQIRGRIALGSGQIFGRGLFSDNLFVPPEVYNDFIFSYIGQTLGFVGCVGVTLLLSLLCVKMLLVARMSRDPLGCYLCAGVFAIFIFQTVVNIGMVLCLLPVIGVTLPLISSGGTSVVTFYLAIGIVLSVYRKNKKKTMFESRGY